MPFSHNGHKTTTGIYRYMYTAVKRFTGVYTLPYRFLNGNVQGCVFAKNRPVSLNWSDYTMGQKVRMTSENPLLTLQTYPLHLE